MTNLRDLGFKPVSPRALIGRINRRLLQDEGGLGYAQQGPDQP